MPAEKARFFDDYTHKNTGKRIRFAYKQAKEVPIFPWEIGHFVNRITTIYYKYELLNSISGAQ